VGKTVGGVTFDRVSPSTANSRFIQRTDSGQPWSQRKQRRGQMFRDDHGRRWFAVTELLSGAPCGMIEHQFQAPLIPPQKYLELSTDPERPYDLHIAYDRRLVRFFETPAMERRAKHRGIDYSTLEAIEEEADPDAVGAQTGRRQPVPSRRSHHKQSPKPDASDPAGVGA
jgi:hypothetical protein